MILSIPELTHDAVYSLVDISLITPDANINIKNRLINIDIIFLKFSFLNVKNIVTIIDIA
ncbi:hypothetical protein LRN_0119 [Ligilactobacillus ruminis DPC 6832]|uniref:Uncharacterized protein n=1 Tax=Ligilactobacillus ruminis DPC 6832 TaxID=1402208 RepID=A0A837DY73_9LACO|nr:hypothetical protein LRN_0119 [Ligilactobacillus ruminis DPC 6832]